MEDVPTVEDNQIPREPNPEEARELVITQFQDMQVFGEQIEQVSNQPQENPIQGQTEPTRRQSNRQRNQIVRFEAGPASGLHRGQRSPLTSDRGNEIPQFQASQNPPIPNGQTVITEDQRREARVAFVEAELRDILRREVDVVS